MRSALLLLFGCFAMVGTIAGDTPIARDYDTPSYIQFSKPRYEVSASETNAVLTVVRTGDFRKIASVDYATREGTAAENTDFQASGGAITFPAGQCYKTISIPVKTAGVEAKTFVVELSQPSPGTIITTPSTEVALQAAPPALAIDVINGALTVSWPDSPSAYKLESHSSSVWAGVEPAPTLANGLWSVRVPQSNAVALFRLRLESTPTN